MARPGRVVAGLAVAVVLASSGCAGGPPGGPPGGGSGVTPCHEGRLRVTGADPFPELTLVTDDGAGVSIARDATELGALDGARVRMCATRVPVQESGDVTSLRLISVDGVEAVLGRVEGGAEGDRLVSAAAGPLGIRAGGDVLVRLRAAGCVWISGRIEAGAIALSSWGAVPESVCALARRGTRQ